MKTFELKPDEIHFFYTQVDEIKNNKLLDKYRSIINKKEASKIDRYFFEKDKHNCLITRALLRFVLAVYTDQAPEDFEFFENKYGKPYLKSGLVEKPIKFNLSHSCGLTVCALSLDHEIGVDIENYQRKTDLTLADRFFSKSESDYIKNCSDKEKQEVFFDFWTLKESYIKAKGMGLSISLNTFSFAIEKKNICINFDESSNDSCDQWSFFRFSPVINYKAAIAIQAAMQNIKTLHIHECIPFGEIKYKYSIITSVRT